MREIKFRALKKLSNYSVSKNVKPKMVYGTGILHDKVNTWLVSNENNHPIGRLLDGDNLKLVDGDTIGQFTGLKDKNGKEIYEGDIFHYDEVRDDDGYILGSEEYVKVELVEELGGFHIVNVNDEPYCTVAEALEDDLYVIGNIYENPELMND